MGEMTESRDQVLRWFAEDETLTRTLAERLTEFMNDVLLRLRPRASVAEAA